MMEVALLLPFVLLPLTFGSIEYGYFFFLKHTLQGAAREGARAGIVQNATNADITSRVATVLHSAGLQPSSSSIHPKFTLTITPADVNGMTVGNPVTVRVSAAWSQIGINALGGLLISQSAQVVGVTVMRREG